MGTDWIANVIIKQRLATTVVQTAICESCSQINHLSISLFSLMEREREKKKRERETKVKKK